MENGWSIIGGRVQGFLEIGITNFISPFLFDLLLMCRLKDNVSLGIFHLYV